MTSSDVILEVSWPDGPRTARGLVNAAVIAKCGFNATRTAEVLGMHRQSLQRLLARHGIERPGGE